ncbi:MAG TPA: hypothetical protein VM389_02255, partial [Phycisphaerae bacterium]|nr:hypothetical protein [Phycisphaerae bacterium]
PLEALAKAEGADAEIIRRTLVDLDEAAGLLLELDGASALPAADRQAARQLAHRAGQVSATWLELLKARNIPLPEPGKHETGSRGIFDDEDDIELPPFEGSTRLCLEIYSFQRRLENKPDWKWELAPDSSGIFEDEPAVGPEPAEDPAKKAAVLEAKAKLADFSKRIAALLTDKKLSVPEGALLRSKVRELTGTLDKAVADAKAELELERRLSSTPPAELPEPSPPMLVASLRQAEAGLEAVAGLEKVHAATIELGLTAAHADLLRLEEYVRVARRELAKKYPADWLEGDPPPWEWAWERFLDPNAPFATKQDGRAGAVKLVDAAAERAARCRQNIERARRAGPPLAGAELADTPEWRRLVRIWRQAAQAASLAAPYNYAGRQRMVLRVALAQADADALAGAGLLSEAEADLLRSGLEALHEFHRVRRHTIATRHVGCYGNGPEQFPMAPSLEGLTKRAALLGKLADSGKLRPEVCLKGLSVVAAELDERTPPFWGIESAAERSRMEAEYKRLQAEARGRVRTIQHGLRPQLGPLGRRPEWQRLFSSLEEIGGMDPAGATVADHLRAIRLMAAVQADMRVLHGAGLLDRTEALLLRDEGAIRLGRLLDAGPSDLRSYTPGGWALYGNDGNYNWLNLRQRPDYRLVARAGLLKALLRRRVADVGPLLRSVAARLEADLNAVTAHLAAGGTLRDLLGPWREDPTGLQEAIAEARKALAAVRMPPRAAPPPPGTPAPVGD